MNKQELENKIKELEGQVKQSQNTIEELKKSIKSINEEKGWKPKVGEEYCSADLYSLSQYTYKNDNFDKEMNKNGNYFKTKEESDRVIFEQNLRMKLRKFAEDNNDKIEWNNTGKEIYYIKYNYDDKEIICDYICYTRDFSQIYFSSEEICKQAIEKFKDELVKYFTEI